MKIKTSNSEATAKRNSDYSTECTHQKMDLKPMAKASTSGNQRKEEQFKYKANREDKQ